MMKEYVSLTIPNVIGGTNPYLPLDEIKRSFDLIALEVRQDTGKDLFVSGLSSNVEKGRNHVLELLKGSVLGSVEVLLNSPKSQLTTALLQLPST